MYIPRLTSRSVESKEKRSYIRAKRDPVSMYFHAAEAPPFYARLSDENHPQCAVEELKNTFTLDMLGKSGEKGAYTTRANVFAREGQFCYEMKIISQHPPGKEPRGQALATSQNADITATDRGSMRVGFCRREHHWGEVVGGNAYSYAVVTRGGHAQEYGSVRFNTLMYHMKGEGAKDIEDLVPGDVVGLMITLPSMEVHKKVVEGTFNSADYPDLKCGPAMIKSKKPTTNKKISKTAGKSKDAEDGKGKDKEFTAAKTEQAGHLGISPLPDLDIIRDRNPFTLKSTMTYFECPEYTPRADLSRPTLNTKAKAVNSDTQKPYELESEPHPNHELPHLRTLPGSKIELWVNGDYHGVVWEHLFAFLPPASTLEKHMKSTIGDGNVDDGLLGYYPAITHYSGGAFECKFDGPWWCGFDGGPPHPDARPIGERYKEQIVEDFVSDLVDEIYLEVLNNDPDWMKRKVLDAALLDGKHV